MFKRAHGILRYIQKRLASNSDPMKECKEWANMKESALEKNEPRQIALKQTFSHEINQANITQTNGENTITDLEHFAENYTKTSLAILQPRTKIVTQQGTAYLGTWEITFDTKERWENPTMGWCSSGNSLTNVVLNFPDKESAVEFMKARGWNYYIAPEPDLKSVKFKPKSYGKNFSYNRRTRVTTK